MQTIKRQSSVERTFIGTTERAYNIIINHPGSSEWIEKVGSVTVTKDGTPHYGAGTIRQVAFTPKMWTTVTEEIISAEPGKGFSYKIIAGMPGLIDHVGQWTLTDQGDGTVKATWAVAFEFKRWHWFSPMLGSFMKSFAEVQSQALEGLALAIKT